MTDSPVSPVASAEAPDLLVPFGGADQWGWAATVCAIDALTAVCIVRGTVETEVHLRRMDEVFCALGVFKSVRAVRPQPDLRQDTMSNGAGSG